MSDEIRDELRRLLMERSVRWGTFQLASGKTSDFFVDVKQTVLTARGHVTVAHCLMDLMYDNVDAVAGVALGGCPLASAVSFYSASIDFAISRGQSATSLDLPALYVRKEKKDHGTKNLIEGSVPEGSAVVLLEDVITTGGSSLRAVKTLEEDGYEVLGVIAVVDRLEGGSDALLDAGVRLRSIFTRRDLLDS